MSHGNFSGTPETEWITDKAKTDRTMRLLSNFSFTDPAGKKWVAPANYKIDGASIPRSLWSLVGSPYTGDYRRASVVHDKACDDAAGNVATRRGADRMFYHACRAGGCSIKEAVLLYIGVRIGSLHLAIPAWSAATVDGEGPTLVMTSADTRLEADFRLIAEKVIKAPEVDDPMEIEARTDEAMSFVTGINLRDK